MGSLKVKIGLISIKHCKVKHIGVGRAQSCADEFHTCTGINPQPRLTVSIYCLSLSLKMPKLVFPGFPSQKGRHRLHHHPSWAEAVCEQVPLTPYVFYPDKPVHIQVSVNHVNFSDPAYVHEAVVPWVEDIRENNFTVCVTQAGRNEKKNGQTFATVDWLAYQGAPDGGVSGEMDMPIWWTGTNCRTVSLPPVSLATEIINVLYSIYYLSIKQPSDDKTN